MMSLLLIFLSVCQFTIDTKDKVVASGDVPPFCIATYSNTYRKGQLTAGNTASLTLQGLNGVCIDEITLSMRSNTASGAGLLSLTADNLPLWEIQDASFASKSWNSSYTTSYVPITHSFQPALQCQSMTLTVTASQSSLYIEHYTITYHSVAARPYQVNFHTSVGQTPAPRQEASTGAGIILPDVAWQDTVWHLAGWTYVPQQSTTTHPSFFRAGTRFYPTSDLTLYALFTNELQGNRLPCTVPSDDGTYLLVDYSMPDLAYYLLPTSEAFVPGTTDLSEALPAAFHLYFLADSLIQISELASLSSEWILRPIGNKQFNLLTTNGYGLGHQLTMDNELTYLIKPRNFAPICFVAEDDLLDVLTPTYTATPFGAAVPAVPAIGASRLVYVLPMGAYQLCIYSDGRKVLKKNGTSYFHKQNVPHTQ